MAMPRPWECFTGVRLHRAAFVLYVLVTGVLEGVAALLTLVTYEFTICPVAWPGGGHTDIPVTSQDGPPKLPGLN